ncbi:MAG: hypothetical protein L3J83_04625 [Proteobacteria bacterium]|nr:hypothetical protein [Pseudomonadota bacterium]
MKSFDKNKKYTLLFLFAVFTNVNANPLSLTHEPLFLNQSVPPALAITMDNSTSMNGATMPGARSFSTNRPSYASSDYNLIYFNPNIDYPPPATFDGSLLPQSDFFNASGDGFYTTGDIVARVDLSKKYRVFRRYRPIYTNGTIHTLTYAQVGRSKKENPAFYYRWAGSANATLLQRRDENGNYLRVDIDVNNIKERDNFANWYTYYNTRSKLARAAISHAFVNFGPDFKIDWQQLSGLRFGDANKPVNMKVFAGNHRKDFYDWLFLVPTIPGTPLRKATDLAGKMFSKGGVGGPYYDSEYGGELSCQQNFHIAISDGGWNGAEGRHGNVDNTSIILPKMPDLSEYTYFPSVQPSKLYSDGNKSSLADTTFHYWSTDLRPNLDNNVPTYIEDYTDSDGDAVEVASDEFWWKKPELFWNPNNDPASWQHMVTFNIGLGIEGSLDIVSDLPKLRDGSLNWPNTGSSQGRIDDVWHSSINSRGKYFGAKDPKELADALYELISNIIKRKGRASSGSVSSSILSAETLSFRTGYDTSSWSGFVTAAPINSDGTLGDPIWDAGCMLTGGACNSLPGNPVVSATHSPITRDIFTFDYDSKTQSNFNVANLSTQQQAKILDSNFFSTSVVNGTPFTVDDIVEYLRGERGQERQSGGAFRNRQSILGDIIHSSAKIILGPANNYLDSDDIWYAGTVEDIASENANGYVNYKAANRNRDNVLLVGANDGMLHAFDAGINTANGGHELWAYIPSKALDGISEFANPAYQHTSYVDSTPVVESAFFKNKWRDVAVGGMRHGGKLFYALDLGNNPKDTPSVLWEFTDEDDEDMGFTYAGATIARILIENGSTLTSKWVAFLPNGYNSKNHRSVLYAVDLETGQLLHKWDTGLGSVLNPNGMGPATTSDFAKYETPSTRVFGLQKDQAAEYIYAGDLHGNLYRFDIRDIGPSLNTTTPDIVYLGSQDKPITVAPELFGIEEQKIIAIFGTGKYIELPDRGVAAVTPQYLIGVLDSDNQSIPQFSLNDSRLIEQEISLGFIETIRMITNKPVANDEGWKIQLPVKGERLVSAITPVLFAQAFFAGTIIPNGNDPCLAGGQSWLMFLDIRSGAVPESGRVLASTMGDGVLIQDILTGINILTPPGGNETIVTLDGVGGSDGSFNLDPIILDIGEKWRRRSWHRILLD